MLRATTIIFLFTSVIGTADTNSKEPVELEKLMKALDECIMFNPDDTKNKIKNSRMKVLLPQLYVSGKLEENDLETNKLAESSPYLLTNFKSGWVIEIQLKWSLDELIYSKDELDIKREYQNSLNKYIELQNKLSTTYYKLIEISRRLEKSTESRERDSLEKEYNLLNSIINVLTCHRFNTINKKEEKL
ncbi:MAG: hypothetical protein N2746_00775 [Deltaproteobacteria bacterium]|nr:hypothetical protein [Deltaproteobacteria bacterium]